MALHPLPCPGPRSTRRAASPLSLAAVPLALAACASAPPFDLETPVPATPPSWTAGETAASEADSLHGPWWRGLEDPNLAALIAEGLAHNHDLAAGGGPGRGRRGPGPRGRSGALAPGRRRRQRQPLAPQLPRLSVLWRNGRRAAFPDHEHLRTPPSAPAGRPISGAGSGRPGGGPRRGSSRGLRSVRRPPLPRGADRAGLGSRLRGAPPGAAGRGDRRQPAAGERAHRAPLRPRPADPPSTCGWRAPRPPPPAPSWPCGACSSTPPGAGSSSSSGAIRRPSSPSPGRPPR